MADIFDEVYGSTSVGLEPATASNPTVIKMNNEPDVFDQVYSAPSKTSGLNAASGQIGKGLAFGFFDEIQGAEAGFQNLLKNVLGRETGETFGSAYDKKVAELREVDTAYEEANPYGSMGLQAAGALLPAIYSGGSSLLAGGVTRVAPTALGSTLKNVFGIGITKTPTLGQLARMGAIQSGLYGAGEANEGSRLVGAGVGATIGGVLAPVVGGIVQKGTNVVSDFLANQGIIGKGTSVASTGAERGSISSALGGVDYTPEEIYLAKKLKDTSLEKITKGATELAETSKSGVPLFLPEAIDSPTINRNARFIANYEPSLEFSQSAIENRAIGAEGRIESLLSNVAPHVDPTDAGASLMSASSEAVKKLERVRRDATSPLYKALESKAIPEETAIQLLDDPVVDAAIKTVGRTPAYQKEIGKASPDSFKYMQLVKENLDDQVNSLATAGNKNEARIVAGSRDKVVTALEQLDEYKQATSLYRKLSEPINKLTGTKEQAGLLEGILNTDRINAHKAPAELLKLTPGQILEVKATLGDKGEEELSKAARSLMQDVLSKVDENNPAAVKLLRNEATKNKFYAMIGADKYNQFVEGIDLEKRMVKGARKYFAGSSTAGNLEEKGSFGEVAGLIGQLKTGDWRAALGSLFSSDMPDELAQEVARIYFDPKRGAGALTKIIPLLEQYAKNKSFSNILGSQTAGGIGKTAGAVAGDMLEPETKTGLGKQLSTVLGSEKKNQSLASKVLGGQEDMSKTPEFEQKAAEVADRLGVEPMDLLKVIGFETGGSFSSTQKNKAGSGATGLIQFMPETAREILRTDTKEEAIFALEQMSPVEQLDVVERYLSKYKGKIKTLDDLYMAVLYPKAIDKDADYALFKDNPNLTEAQRRRTAYGQNKGLDLNKDGRVTKNEAASKVRKYNV